jgi:hypothetical protein
VYIDDDDDDFDTYLADDEFALRQRLQSLWKERKTYVSVLLEGDMMIGLHHWLWEKGFKVKFRLQYL